MFLSLHRQIDLRRTKAEPSFTHSSYNFTPKEFHMVIGD